MDNAQNPTGPVLTAAESRRRVLHNMCSSLLYNLSVILFGLLLPRLYLTSFGSELNGLDSTIKQIFSCLTLLEAGVGLASQQAYYLPVAVGDGKAINGIFSATHHYYRRTGIVYLLVTVVFALLYPLCINTVLSYGTVSLIVVFSGMSLTRHFAPSESASSSESERPSVWLGSTNRAQLLYSSSSASPTT